MLPTWNEVWEKPDPLRGRRGWTWPDYANIGVAVFLTVATFALLMPRVIGIREADGRIQRINKQRELELKQLEPWLILDE